MRNTNSQEDASNEHPAMEGEEAQQSTAAETEVLRGTEDGAMAKESGPEIQALSPKDDQPNGTEGKPEAERRDETSSINEKYV